MEFVPAARRQGERGLKPLQHGVNSRDRGGDCLRVGAIQLELASCSFVMPGMIRVSHRGSSLKDWDIGTARRPPRRGTTDQRFGISLGGLPPRCLQFGRRHYAVNPPNPNSSDSAAV